MVDFAIEGFGGSRVGIGPGDGQAETGLFPYAGRQVLDAGIDGGFALAHFFVEQGGFRGLGADEPPFVRDEAVEELLFGVALGIEQGEPALAEECELFGIFVAEEERNAFGLRAGIAAVLAGTLLGALATGLGVSRLVHE